MFARQSLVTTLSSTFRQTPGQSLISVLIFGVILYVLYRFAAWGLWDATFENNLAVCRAGSGACWGFVEEKWRVIVFGRFPYEEQWRAAIATVVVCTMTIVSAVPLFWRRSLYLIAGWVLSLACFFILMYGGIFGLKPIDTDLWGGLPLTVVLTVFGMSASTPIGILLAFGRRSEMPLIRLLSSGYIELVRGVPLITVLFVATYIFPMILPQGFSMSAFWRVVLGIVLFQAAYMAETVRGGLQTIPSGQTEAALSLGMSYWQTNRLVVLPQALLCIIPAFVNSLLSTFMDTSLVTVVSMYDLTGALRLALGDPLWRSYFIEGYFFVAAIYFVASLSMSRYSLWLEKRLNPHRHER
ncbi:MAG TPA: amino acid ABC transporter permease [Sutterella sp.]|nr:amino acid ABC transporter permease [Sutterella sp.]